MSSPRSLATRRPRNRCDSFQVFALWPRIHLRGAMSEESMVCACARCTVTQRRQGRTGSLSTNF
jgi:hypothetical protein